MESNNRSISVDEEIKVSKLKVKVGMMLYDGRIILIYESLHQKDDEPKQKKLKSTEVGIVKKILVKEGDIVPPGSVIVELEKKCNHPTVIKDLCAECGADLQKENTKEGGHVSTASVSMIHMIPELKVDQEHAQILGKADMDRLLEHKKLVLLVDLDQTIIHTTNDNIPNNIKNVYHFQLYGPQSPWYHTRLRPGTHDFLQSISQKYELHICTFGSRRYAHTITRFLDPDGKLFSHRILSRDECFDPNSKTANLKALFPCGEKMVCIIDDREDVWDYASNLIHVKPYHFFQHTGDIHAPPGLTKCENDDDKEGYDFTLLNESQNNDTSKLEENDEEMADSEKSKNENIEESEIKNPNEEADQNGESVIDGKSSGDLNEPVDLNSMLDETAVIDVDLQNNVNFKSDAEKTPATEVVLQSESESKSEKTPHSKVLKNEETSKLDETPVPEVLENEESSKPDETPVSESAQQSDEKSKLDETAASKVLKNEENSKPDRTLVAENAQRTDENSNPDETPDIKDKSDEPFVFNVLENNENVKPEETTAENILSTEPTDEMTALTEKPNDPEPNQLVPEKDDIDAPDLTTKPSEPGPNAEIPSEPTSRPPLVETQAIANISKPHLDENGFVIIEESDDYLLYLEEILKNIHAEFFRRLEETKVIPDLKVLIPETRAKVLEGVSIVFSGIVPNRVKLEDSQAYKIARSLGAQVTQNIENSTTHLVALRCGTAKVHAAYRRRNLKLVTPEWLWTCAERWEKVDERMFPLRNAIPNTGSRNPPAHCRSPEHPEPLPFQITNKVNSNQGSGFMYSINPLMSLSSEDIESMAGEVEDMFKESDGEADGADDAFVTVEEDDTNDATPLNIGKKRKLQDESSSSSEEEDDESRFEKFSKIKKHKRCKKIEDNFDINKTLENEDDDEDEDEKDEDLESDDDDDDETINTKFRRGEQLPSDLDIDYNTEGTEEEQESDGEWNVMGAALEREFLEGD